MANGVDEMFNLDATLHQVEEKRRVEAEAERESRVLFFNTLQIQTTAIEIVIRLSGSSTPPHGSLLWRKSTRRFSIFSKLSFSFPSFLMFTLPLLA